MNEPSVYFKAELNVSLRAHMETFATSLQRCAQHQDPITGGTLLAVGDAFRELLTFCDREAAFYGVDLMDIKPNPAEEPS